MGRKRKWASESERIKAFKETPNGIDQQLTYESSPKAIARKRWQSQDVKRLNITKRTAEFEEIYGNVDHMFMNQMLTEREKEILALYFGLLGNSPNHIDKCATLLKIELETAKKLKYSALKKLRKT